MARRASGKTVNTSRPIKLRELLIHGVAAETTLGGGQAKIWTRLGVTSDDPMFHTIAKNFVAVVEHAAALQRKSIPLETARTVLLRMRLDNSADVWIDNAALVIEAIAKRAMQAGTAVFDHDIADVVGMDFPQVKIEPEDRIICIFRVGWRFALFFDFNPAGAFDRKSMRRDMGTLYRILRYRNVYDTVANSFLFERLVSAGWFPFVEIMGREFDQLASLSEAGLSLDGCEEEIGDAFTPERLQHMLDRWIRQPHFASKEAILRAAIAAYERRDPVASIKIAVTEIEGVLRSAYRSRYGKSANLKTLLRFAVASAEEKAGAPNTLLFPQAFGNYLANYTFATFDPNGSPGTAGSRHAVGHGVAEAHTYTQTRALQTLLTLDQLAFYT